jgi:hypothetical protein
MRLAARAAAQPSPLKKRVKSSPFVFAEAEIAALWRTRLFAKYFNANKNP